MRVRIGKFQMTQQTRKRILRVLSALLALLLAIYCFYHFTTWGESEIKTMLATKDTVERSVFGEAVLFRDEIALPSAYSGLSVPLVTPGAHVAKDTAVATVYSDGAECRDAYRLLEISVSALRAAEHENDTLDDLSDLQGEIEALMCKLTASLEQGDGTVSAEYYEALRVLSCRVQALTDSDASLEAVISALEAEQKALLSSAGTAWETVTVPQGGYYYPDADEGYLLCTLSALENITGASLVSLKEILSALDESAQPTGAGTLVRSSEWFIAVTVDLNIDELAALPTLQSYSVEFSDNGNTRIPMTLERILEPTEAAPAVLVFSTLRMPSGFSFDRLQNVRIVTGTMEGFSVPRGAIYTVDGFQGVYVLEGSVMYFCRVEVLYDLGSRALVKTTDPTPSGEYTENTYRYLALYDAMIVSGSALFHGRVLS